MSGQELAVRVGYKHQSSIGNLENRPGSSGGDRIYLIADALGVPVDWLLRGPDGENVPEAPLKTLTTSEESVFKAGQSNNVTYSHQERMATQHVGESSAPFPGASWPFTQIKPEQYALLSERQKGIIEGFALNMLKEQTDVKSGSTRAA